MQHIVQELLEGVSNYVAQLNEARKQADDAYMRINATVEQMEIVSRQESNYLKSVGAMQAEISHATDEFTAAIGKLSDRFAADVGRAAAGLDKAAGNLKNAGQELADVHTDATRSITNELNTTLDSYRDYVNQFTQRVDYLATSIAGSLDRMPDAVNEANNRFLDQVDALTDTLEQAQRAIDSAVGRMYRN